MRGSAEFAEPLPLVAVGPHAADNYAVDALVPHAPQLVAPQPSACSILREATELLQRAVEAQNAEDADLTACRAKVIALEAELEAAAARARARESFLERELAAERQARAKLASELDNFQQKTCAQSNAIVGDDTAKCKPASSSNCADDERHNQIAADYIRLVARSRKMKELIEKQKQRLNEYDARLKACAVANHASKRRKRMSDQGDASTNKEAVGCEKIVPVKTEVSVNHGIVANIPSDPDNQKAQEPEQHEKVASSGACVTKPWYSALPKRAATAPLPSGSLSGKCADPVDREETGHGDTAEVPGIKVYKLKPGGKSISKRMLVPEEGVGTSDPSLQIAGPFRAVRAEGRKAAAAAAADPQGVPCRCVVRGKAERLALPAFDCDQCNKFYSATGMTTGAGNCKTLQSSRHRFHHAPTATPPGFWDLSFPLEA